MHSAFLARSASAIPLELVTAKGLGAWTKEQDDRIKVLVDAVGFRADAGKTCIVTKADGAIEKVIVGVGEASDGYVLASLPGSLPAGDYAIASAPEGLNAETLALGWADGAYRFTKYKAPGEKPRRLVLP